MPVQFIDRHSCGLGCAERLAMVLQAGHDSHEERDRCDCTENEYVFAHLSLIYDPHEQVRGGGIEGCRCRRLGRGAARQCEAPHTDRNK
jgi:hypothetical protein